jgi:hypothetical protein
MLTKWTLIVSAACLVGIPNAAPVNITSYASLTGTGLITFDDLASAGVNGANYDNLFESDGASFGERFVGQSVVNNGGFDAVTGSPTGGLSLATGSANHNLSLLEYNGSNVLAGLGPDGFPNYSAIGEGAFAVLFDYDQSQFGFQLVGGDFGSATVDFYTRSGALIESQSITGLANDYYGFLRDGGIQDIAGIVIYNIDGGGVGFDNLRHDVPGIPGTPDSVPEPSTMAFFGLGLLGLAGARKKFGFKKA